MSLNKLTQFYLSNEHGITGNLAAKPTFSKTDDGDEYASFAIYCAPYENNSEHKPRKRKVSSKKNETLPLIAYVTLWDDKLLDAAEELDKGYFVNFSFDTLKLRLGENEETGELRINLSFSARDFTIRSIPGRTKLRQQDNEDANTTSSRKKASPKRKPSKRAA